MLYLREDDVLQGFHICISDHIYISAPLKILYIQLVKVSIALKEVHLKYSDK